MTTLVLCIVLIAAVVFLVKSGRINNAEPHPSTTGVHGQVGFNPDYSHKNIAIDTKQDKIWLRDKSGEVGIFDKSHIQRWDSDVAHGKEGFWASKMDKPSIRIHVTDMKRPQFEVVFDSFTTGNTNNIFTKNKNERDEWFSRLSTWRNHT